MKEKRFSEKGNKIPEVIQGAAKCLHHFCSQVIHKEERVTSRAFYMQVNTKSPVPAPVKIFSQDKRQEKRVLCASSRFVMLTKRNAASRDKNG